MTTDLASGSKPYDGPRIEGDAGEIGTVTIGQRYSGVATVTA
jgi:hypothetical protein